MQAFRHPNGEYCFGKEDYCFYKVNENFYDLNTLKLQCIKMEKQKSRLSRLTAILTQLQAKKLVTARELAVRHGVSIRTIYRDIRTLEKAGIPIFTEEGKGFALMEGYLLSPIMFTESEANALITAEQLVNRNKDYSLIVLNKRCIKA